MNMNVVVKPKTPKYVFLRGKVYYYIRNIPERYRHKFENQKQVWQSLKTGNFAEAVRFAEILSREYDRKINSDGSASTSFSFADELAHAELLNITHEPSAEFRLATIERSIQLMAERVNIALLMNDATPLDVATIVGKSDTPPLTMNAALERFLEITPEFTEDVTDWDARQKINKYRHAAEDFVARVGDIDVLKFDDGLASDYLLSIKNDVVVNKAFKSDYANRQISIVRVILREVLDHDYKRKFTALDGKKIKRDDAGKRPGFTEADVKALRVALPSSKMSEQAQDIVKLALITGCGVKELCWLTADDIKPDAKTPHIRIGKNALRSRVKSGGDRHRDIPIVTAEGVDILRKYPNGFTRFQDQVGPSRINKEFSPFFKSVTPGRTFNSARHRMDDLLKISGADLGIKASLSGHSLGGHLHYYGKSGNAYTLKQKKEALEKALAAAPIKEEQENERD